MVTGEKRHVGDRSGLDTNGVPAISCKRLGQMAAAVGLSILGGVLQPQAWGQVGTPGNITTVAGTGLGGFSGDNGPANLAQLNSPEGVAVDSGGNLFIAEQANVRIRRVDAAAGFITTVAGDGISGFLGNGGPAVFAEFQSPAAVAVDSAGNLYIADTINQRIRRVDAASGIITTYAGNGTPSFGGDDGPATGAELNFPNGVATDGNGSVIIADSGNNRIRRVDATTGIITTIAGNGTNGFSGDGGPATAAELNDPTGIALDKAGNLFIGDGGNSRVRRIDATTGIITTVAGNGTFIFSGDGGPATAAGLFAPFGVTLDESGNLYIADAGNNRIRRVDGATGIITTVAGNGMPALSGDGGPATAAGLEFPTGVALDNAGRVYIADHDNASIRRVDIAEFSITTTNGEPTESATVTAGQSTTFFLQANSFGGLTGAINVACSGVPATVTCTPSAPSIDLAANNAVAFTVSVSTAARGGASLFPLRLPTGGQPFPFAPVLALLSFALVTKQFKMRRLRMIAPAALCLAVFAGCGGSNTTAARPTPIPTPTPAPAGTAAGTYTLTITGTQGMASRSLNVTLKVN